MEPKTYLAGATVIRYRLGKFSGANIIHNTATETDDPVGVILNDAESTEYVTVDHLCGGPIEMTAAGSISAGADVYAAAAGKVQALPTASGTYRRVGKALKAATADGDIIEILPYNDGKTTVVS